mmetsp:Transcript_66409/g.182166  ORF Transcript_66409/g.182166 Transcript_66409/m.182166 type:complete len:80 (-) Transcript_66409:957-1196(-)
MNEFHAHRDCSISSSFRSSYAEASFVGWTQQRHSQSSVLRLGAVNDAVHSTTECVFCTSTSVLVERTMRCFTAVPAPRC